MFSKKKLFFLAIFLLFCYFAQASEISPTENSSGLEICDSLCNYFSDKKLHFKTQEITSSLVNKFPYNITIDINSKKKQTKNKLLLIFSIREIINNKDVILSLIDYVKNEDFSFDTTFLFSYESDVNILSDFSQISGNKVYINSIDTNNEYIVLNISLTEINSIISSSHNKTSPDWLIKETYNSFLNENFDFNNKHLYSSFFDKLFYNNDETIDLLFTNEIKCIGINFDVQNDNRSSLLSIMKNIINTCDENFSTDWTEHLFGISLNKKFVWCSELFLLKFLLLISIIVILIFLILIFIDSAIKKIIWLKLKSVWFIIPFFLLISYLTFYFLNNYLLISFFILFLLISLFLFIFQNKILIIDRNSFYLLIFISSSINLLFFAFIDISLILLLMPLFVISLFTLILRKKTLHLVLSLFILLYSFSIILINYKLQLSYLYINNIQNKVVDSMEFSLLVLPTLFLWFTFISKIKEKFSKIFTYGVLLFVTMISLILVISIDLFLIKQKNQINQKESYTFRIDKNSTKIQTFLSTEDVFSDKVTNLSLNIDDEPLFCQIIVSSSDNSFIFYSDDDFEIINPLSNQFIIPSYPPKIMLFSFGTNVENLKIDIKVISKTEIENEFTISEKTLTFGE